MLKFAIQLFEPCFRWTGRIDRRTFYGSLLAGFVPVYALATLVSVPAAFIASVLNLNSFGSALAAIYPPLATVFALLVMSALIAQRAHDVGHPPAIYYSVLAVSLVVSEVVERTIELEANSSSGGWGIGLLMFVGLPGIAAFFLLVFLPGQKSANEHGPPA